MKQPNTWANKRGGYHCIILNIPVRGHVPIKMDGSEYHSDDEQDSYGERMAEDRSIIKVASEKDVESFIMSCRLSDEDLPNYHYAIEEDVRRRTGYGYIGCIQESAVEEFFESVTLHPEPIRGKELCEFLRKGIFVMASEVTTYFLIVHIGNDFTSLFKKDIEKCRDSGKCTFTVTNRAFAAQRASKCRTCFGDDITMAICDNCIACCHKGHDTYVTVKSVTSKKGRRHFAIPKTLMYCDCGHKLSCKLLDECE